MPLSQTDKRRSKQDLPPPAAEISTTRCYSSWLHKNIKKIPAIGSNRLSFQLPRYILRHIHKLHEQSFVVNLYEMKYEITHIVILP